MGTMIIKILRLIGLTIDHLAAFLLMTVYEMFVQISDAGIFKQSDIRQFSTRIYAFLGLIMVFKVSISLVSYIMNPDNFSKGDVGAPAIIKGFVFALVGIVVVPYIFEIAFSAQRIILKNNIIGNLIMGISNGTNNDKDYMWTAGRSMASTTLRAFIKPNTNIDVIDENCAEAPANCEAFLGLFDKKDKVKEIFSEDPVSPYKLLDPDLLNATVKADGKEVFVMDYTFIISTLCLLFIAYILLLFCFDVAVRAVKLSFLQLIAPIPLIAKIDPKKGGKIFDNWVKECTTTYLDLFFRVAAIFFALFLISSLSGVYHISDGSSYSFGAWIYVEVFLIIGILNFARELPKLLSTILGIDLKGLGGFSLNPLKNKNLAPVGDGLGIASSAASAFRRGRRSAQKDENGKVVHPVRNFGKSLLYGAGGALGGALKGTAGVLTGKNYGDIITAQNKRNSELELAQLQKDGRNKKEERRELRSRFLGFRDSNLINAAKSMEYENKKQDYESKKASFDLSEKHFNQDMESKKAVLKTMADIEEVGKEKIKDTYEYYKRYKEVEKLKQKAEAATQRYASASEADKETARAEMEKYAEEYKTAENAANFWAANDGLYSFIRGEFDDVKRDKNGNFLVNEAGQYTDENGNVLPPDKVKKKKDAKIETLKNVAYESAAENFVDGKITLTLSDGGTRTLTEEEFHKFIDQYNYVSEDGSVNYDSHTFMGQLSGDIKIETAEHTKTVAKTKVDLDNLKEEIDDLKTQVDSNKHDAESAEKVVNGYDFMSSSGKK